MLKNKLPNIVAIGGGTGLSTFLSGLRYFPVNITAIVTVADDGGSSGRLKNIFNIPSPGDIRNVTVSLSNAPREWNRLLQYRFDEKDSMCDLKGHTIGNLIIAALTKIYDNNFEIAVRKLCKLLSTDGKVIPVSYNSSTLCLKDIEGKIIEGESNFHKNNKIIEKVFYEKKVNANDEAIKAIKNADIIILGPGSLYTSILPNIIISDIKDAINNCTAEVLYICNIMTEKGETQGYSVLDHVKTIKRHGIKRINKILINNGKIPEKILQNYLKDGCDIVINDCKKNSIISNFVQINKNTIRHHPIKIASAIYSFYIENI